MKPYTLATGSEMSRNHALGNGDALSISRA
jgi:hypothetical protein